MVDPSPPITAADEKAALRKAFRAARKDHVAALPSGLRALMLSRPPAPVGALFAGKNAIGLYDPVGAEAPTLGWARWLAEQGHTVALPAFDSRDDAMQFRIWDNPFDEDLLTPSPWGARQPAADSPIVVPELVVVPLLAFTEQGARLGQGGGHYDRWLAAHPHVTAIGLAWDAQRSDSLPTEPHDHTLTMVVTPTRIYEMHA